MSDSESLRAMLTSADPGFREQAIELLRALPAEQASALVSGIASLRYLRLHDLSLDGLDLRGRAAHSLTLSSCRLRGADLSEARLHQCRLTGCDLTDASLRDATLTGCDLSGAVLAGTDLTGAALRSVSMRDIDLSRLTLRGATLETVRMPDALRGAALAGVRLRRCDLAGADLSGADLSGADLCTCDLAGATLVGADLSGADLRAVDLRGADLTDAPLTGADLRFADLRGATVDPAQLAEARTASALRDGLPGPVRFCDHRDLSGADLSGHDLRRASLEGASLRGADLSGADLREAWLGGADLSGANLTGADLTDASLERASLRGADLTGATLTRTQALGAITDLCTRADAPLPGAWTLMPAASLRGVHLSRCDFRGADLRFAELTDSTLYRVDLRDAVLSGAHLEGCRLVQCDLRGADLRDLRSGPRDTWEQLDLRGADLRGVTVPAHASFLLDAHTRMDAPPSEEVLKKSLINVIGRGANLRYAFLAGADLRGADLRDADLTGADLTGADLTGADLTGATFRGARPPGRATERAGLFVRPPGPVTDGMPWLEEAACIPLWPGAWVLERRPEGLIRRRYSQLGWTAVVRPTAQTVAGHPLILDLSDPEMREEALIRLALEMAADPRDIQHHLILRGYSGVQHTWTAEAGLTSGWYVRLVTETPLCEAGAIARLWAEHLTRQSAGQSSAGESGFSTYNPPYPPFSSPRSDQARREIEEWTMDQARQLTEQARRWWLTWKLGARSPS